MQIEISELLELIHQNSYPQTITIKVKTCQDTLTEPIEIQISGETKRITQIGLYKLNDLKIWIVKE